AQGGQEILQRQLRGNFGEILEKFSEPVDVGGHLSLLYGSVETGDTDVAAALQGRKDHFSHILRLRQDSGPLELGRHRLGQAEVVLRDPGQLAVDEQLVQGQPGAVYGPTELDPAARRQPPTGKVRALQHRLGVVQVVYRLQQCHQALDLGLAEKVPSA